MTKVCPMCKQDLPLTAFSVNNNRKDAVSTYCIVCGKSYYKRLRWYWRYEVLSHYSNGTPKCACCGETKLEFLSLDHINGGGKKHIQSIGYNLSAWLRKNNYPEGYRVLCHNCNFALGHYSYCPHTSPESIIMDAAQSFV